MKKEEFLQKMRDSLDGQVLDFIISDNINYYSNYIDNEISNGKSEEEVLNMLGDPRLLAKTIIETQGTDNYQNHSYSEYNNDQNNYNDYKDINNENQEDEMFDDRIHHSNFHILTGAKGCLISIIIFALLFIILRFVLSVAFYFAIPIGIILLISWLYRKLR